MSLARYTVLDYDAGMVKVRIQAAAKRRGLKNANQLAKSVGVSRMVGVRLWEGSQEPTLSTLEKICEAWDCELSELVTICKKRKLSPAREKRTTKSGKSVAKR